jgi:hypothetical protein
MKSPNEFEFESKRNDGVGVITMIAIMMSSGGGDLSYCELPA